MKISNEQKMKVNFGSLVKIGNFHTRKQELVFSNLKNRINSKHKFLFDGASDDVVIKANQDDSLLLRYIRKDSQQAGQHETLNNVAECNITKEDSIPQAIKKSFEFLLKEVNK